MVDFWLISHAGNKVKGSGVFDVEKIGNQVRKTCVSIWVASGLASVSGDILRKERKHSKPYRLVVSSAQTKQRKGNKDVWACENVSAQVNQRKENPCGLVVGPNIMGCR